MTFAELIFWYLKLKSVQKLASFKRVEGALGNFNKVFGDRIVSSLKPLDLEDYQEKREEEGLAPATIDMEISLAKTMISKAFDNDLVDGRTVKASATSKGNSRRQLTLGGGPSPLMNTKTCIGSATSPPGPFITVAFHTGMRTGD